MYFKEYLYIIKRGDLCTLKGTFSYEDYSG